MLTTPHCSHNHVSCWMFANVGQACFRSVLITSCIHDIATAVTSHRNGHAVFFKGTTSTHRAFVQQCSVEGLITGV